MSLPLTDARLAANRENAQHSTGPRTPEGKAAISRNGLRHGLSGAFAVLPWEVREQFDELVAELRAEHRPSTPTEQILVDRMAQHHWLALRALTCQQLCFHPNEPGRACQSDLALYLRYQATHERAFSKCPADLLKLRAERRKEASGFESQKRAARVESRQAMLHAVRLETAEIRFERLQNQPTRPSSRPATPAEPQTMASVS